jgi:hypothetical protein
MKEPPPYVSDVTETFIELKSLDDSKRAELASLGFTIERYGWDRELVRFPAADGYLFDNAKFVEVFCRLNAAGMIFGDDSHGWPPAAIMRELQTRGIVKTPFTGILRGGSGWFTTIYER